MIKMIERRAAQLTPEADVSRSLMVPSSSNRQNYGEADPHSDNGSSRPSARKLFEYNAVHQFVVM